jgi:hypothetical protein
MTLAGSCPISLDPASLAWLLGSAGSCKEQAVSWLNLLISLWPWASHLTSLALMLLSVTFKCIVLWVLKIITTNA